MPMKTERYDGETVNVSAEHCGWGVTCYRALSLSEGCFPSLQPEDVALLAAGSWGGYGAQPDWRWMSHAEDMYLLSYKVLEIRPQMIVEPQIQEEKCDFSPGCKTVDQIFTPMELLVQLCEQESCSDNRTLWQFPVFHRKLVDQAANGAASPTDSSIKTHPLGNSY
ncbi:hypothetical protein CRENBAI_016508 [Crenichthys baileyi]|uniref:Uncharacterized protein n=1 Tax=Crenichthys baileyi TaxID=28760 RepID=A0AAV9S7H3_9TELE